jgi:8-oxo-dGTP pyrophosphatase MutT (NUDIX family)
MPGIKIGCIAVIPYQDAFLGIQCKKGRGIILPGGRYEPEKDASYHATAVREAEEECGVLLSEAFLKYITCQPDGGDFMTYAFYAELSAGTPRETAEGIPCVATWHNLIYQKSPFSPYYRVLKDVMKGKYQWES